MERANSHRAVRVIGSVFRLRRDLVPHVKQMVRNASSLTLEEADMLLDLYGAKELKWDDPKADDQGYVLFGDLKNSLVHGALLTRRVAALQSAGLVERKKTSELAGPNTKRDRKSKSVRISEKGLQVARVIYEKYSGFCERLLKEVPVADAEALLRTNELLMKKLQWEA
jgi:hypothetical protein